MEKPPQEFKPFVSDDTIMPEFTVKSVVLGAIFGILFGAANVYLALRAGLTVSASIPIAVIAITLGRRFFKTTILENNIIQTTGSAGESVASGVVFTLPGFLFLSAAADGKSVGADYFNYVTILILAILGGILGTLMMIPLRRSLIVKEHGTLPYPEGTACASVLEAGEKGGEFARTAFLGLGFAVAFAALQRVFHIIAETPAFVTRQANKFFPSAQVAGDITPEYLGIGYIIGFRICGVLVAGGVLAWLGLIPLLASLIPMDTIAIQLIKLGYLKDIALADTTFGWNPVTHTFADTASAVYYAYIRPIGAGAVTAGGFITLIKTIPTIISSFKESFSSIGNTDKGVVVKRTERDLSFKVVIFGSLGLVILMALLPQVPGDNILSKLFVGLLVVVFGAFFVTVASRIVGLIGSSNSPVSGMTIATLMGTCLIFIAVGFTGKVYEPMALVVGGMICIAAANAGATSQDLKTGYIVGATPRLQQISLFIGVIVSSVVIGLTVKLLDTPTREMVANGITHAIGTKTYSAPQPTLMATLIKGILSHNLDWQFVLVGVFISVVIELCGVNSLSFAVGAYLPLSTTLPIFAGGCVKRVVDWNTKRKNEKVEDAELGSGSLFATGLVAGGALAGVVVALLSVNDNVADKLKKVSAKADLTNLLGIGGYDILGALFFVTLALVLYRYATKK